MVEHAQRSEVGAVGARLVYPDGSLQHGGVVLGLGGVAGHLLPGLPAGDTRFALWDRVVRPYSAVTGACLLVRRSVFDEVGGFDPAYAIAFNDVDFCLRLRRAGYRVLYTPHAELVHYESVSRGLSGYFLDYQRFLRQWGDELRAGDPWFSPNLSRLDGRCALKPAGEDEAWTALIDGLLVPEGAFGYPADLFP
jgi:GT2 family glycosyltransferase